MRKFFFILIIISLFIACKSQPDVIDELEVPVVFVYEPPETEEIPQIEILEPKFSIVSIIILQADIVVTEFETTLRVENPNVFAVELSQIVYELYGNGTFWADGEARNIFVIPADSVSETKFRFEMNFINMNRQLLNDVIAMRRINYRFKGHARVQPDIPNVQAFIANYDISGLSDVGRR